MNVKYLVLFFEDVKDCSNFLQIQMTFKSMKLIQKCLPDKIANFAWWADVDM